MGNIFLLFMAISLGNLIAEAYNTPDGLATPNYTLYYSSEDFFMELEGLVARHSSNMTMEVKRLNASGYAAEVHVVTTPTKQKLDEKIRILLNFGQHGRELISSEVALRLLKILSKEHSINNDKVNQILSATVFKIVPMENVNGRKIVEAGNLCERKNGRGVDTNRNWSVNWGKKEKDYDPAEEYPGTKPFSEPEAEIIRDIAQSFRPHLWVNVHSGMQALFMPYDHKNSAPRGSKGKHMKILLNSLNKSYCDGKCLVGPGGTSVGYLAHGTATDYMYEILKVPLAFTFEIYGDLLADPDDCFRMFNPITSESFENVLSRWSMAFIDLAYDLPQTLNMMSKTNIKSRKLWDLTGDGDLSVDASYLQFLVIGLLMCLLFLRCKGPLSENKVS